MFKLPSGVDINNLIDDLRLLSWKAADILLHYSHILKNRQDAKEIMKNKSYDDPITAADLEVNDLIISGINENYKKIDWGILSEENAKIGYSNHIDINSKWLWVLDPLDGTKDFIQGTVNYAMHLALNYEKKPYIGLVLIPERGELWFTDGISTFCGKRDGSIRKTNIQNVKKNLNEMTLVTSKNHRNEILKHLISKAGFKKVKVMGSIGCKIASIIRGECDIYISLSLPGKSSPKDWDFAAPEAILKAAGGAITNLENEELSYGKPRFSQGGIIIASNNKKTHKNTCLIIKEIIIKNNLYPLS